MKLIKKKKGFTLIELMAVIAIVAILAAVLVPTVSGYITRSKKMAVITQSRTVMNAIESYNITASNTIPTDADETNASTTTVATIVAIDGEEGATADGALTVAQLLTSEEVEQVLNVPTYVIAAINSDNDAINNITIDDDKSLKAYTNGTINWTKPAV